MSFPKYDLKELDDAIAADLAYRESIRKRNADRAFNDMACTDSLAAAKADQRRIDAAYEAWLLK